MPSGEDPRNGRRMAFIWYYYDGYVDVYFRKKILLPMKFDSLYGSMVAHDI